MTRAIQIVCVAAIVAALGSAAIAVNIAIVPVGNVDNSADSTGYGAVDYKYNIGKHEVSNTEYAQFLNAVATVGDPHGLYNTGMGSGWNDIGGISRTGSGTGGDPWVYSPRANRGNRPVNYVSWGDAARFANWLHNGQPTGAQDATATEDGAYYLNGATSNEDLMAVSRESDWQWAIPTEDEWYKAAYHKNDGVTGNYYDYPTGRDTAPTAEVPTGTDMINGSANYRDGDFVDTTYWTTECGAYDAKPSDSPYNTFDQGGNVWEWNEAIIGSYRGYRGATFDLNEGYLHVSYRHNGGYPTHEDYGVGFRVSEVPEPATLSLLALGSLMFVRKGKGERR